MKETTPSKFPHESGSVFNYIETHKPVVIKSRDHHDIIMVLATDYLDMQNENKKLKSMIEHGVGFEDLQQDSMQSNIN